MDWHFLILIIEGLAVPALVGAGFLIAKQSGRIARSESRLEAAEAAVSELRGMLRAHTDGAPELLQRMATIEARMDAVGEQLGRIEAMMAEMRQGMAK